MRPLNGSTDLTGFDPSLRGAACSRMCMMDQKCSAFELNTNGSCLNYGGLDSSFLQEEQGSSWPISYASDKMISGKNLVVDYNEPLLEYPTCSNFPASG